MANFLRLLLGAALLPACWGAGRAFFLCLESGVSANAETFSLLGGVAAFAVCWAFLPHPVKTYVFGHELTHAIWGLLFGARPSRMKVGENGGSVMLSKSNIFITLAPYFFPFYTFIVILAALAVSLFAKRLPCMPAWLFAVGFTWSFHVLFTLQSLSHEQPDIDLYGRLFSWTFIFIANALLLILWLVAATPCTASVAAGAVASSVKSAYACTWSAISWCWTKIASLRG